MFTKIGEEDIGNIGFQQDGGMYHTTEATLNVLCGFWSRGIIGPFLFENKQEEVVTVNSDRFRAMLNEFLFTKIEEEDIGNI